MKFPKNLFDKKSVLSAFAAVTTLDALITYVALKMFSDQLEEGNYLLNRLIDSIGLEWALIGWFVANIAILPLLYFFWERFPIRCFIFVAIIGRVAAVIYNIDIIGGLLAGASRLL